MAIQLVEFIENDFRCVRHYSPERFT